MRSGLAALLLVAACTPTSDAIGMTAWTASVHPLQPVVGHEGDLAWQDGTMTSLLSSDGARQWQQSCLGPCLGIAGIGRDGSVYTFSEPAGQVALMKLSAPAGGNVWFVQLPLETSPDAMLDARDNVWVFINEPPGLDAPVEWERISPDGLVQASGTLPFEVDLRVSAAPPDGGVVVRDIATRGLVALDSTGHEAWRLAGPMVAAGVTDDGEWTVVKGDGDPHACGSLVIKLDAERQERWWRPTECIGTETYATLDDGSLVIGATDAFLSDSPRASVVKRFDADGNLTREVFDDFPVAVLSGHSHDRHFLETSEPHGTAYNFHDRTIDVAPDELVVACRQLP